MDHFIAYGRVNPDPNLEPVGRRFQRSCIRSQLTTRLPIHMEFDAVPGDASFAARPALQLQLMQARATQQNLVGEAMDRIVATYDADVVAGIRAELTRFGVQVAVAHINQPLVRRMKRVLASGKPRQQKRRKLVPLVSAHLRWREGTIMGATTPPDEVPDLDSYDDLEKSSLFPVLTRCADHLVRLKTDAPDLDWCVHSFLGGAWEARTRLLLDAVLSPTSQLGYGQRPDDPDMFQAIRRMEQEELRTFDGRPKAMSNQAIADQLNEMGFTNLRRAPFSRKTIFQIRRSPAYLGAYRQHNTENPGQPPRIESPGETALNAPPNPRRPEKRAQNGDMRGVQGSVAACFACLSGGLVRFSGAGVGCPGAACCAGWSR